MKVAPSAFRWLMFGVVFVTALVARSLTYVNVVTPWGVQFPLPGDLYYHVRRIWYSTVNFPSYIDVDPYVSFPNGAEIVWPPLYDWTIAALARLFVGPESQGRFEHFVIWVPPLIGAATAVLAAWVAVRAFGARAGWWAGLLFAVLPASFMYSQLGQLDHHGAVALATTAMLAAAMATLARDDERSWLRGGGLGFAMATVILLWPGALLHVGIVQAALGVWWLAAEEREGSVRRGRCVAVGQAVCALVLAPFCLGQSWAQYGAWSPLVLSNFQPVYFASAAVGAMAASVLFDRTELGASRTRRIATTAALVVALVAAALVALPAVRESLLYASGWFAQEEDFQSHVNELRPLLVTKRQFDPSVALQRFGFVFLLFPVVVGRIAWTAWRDGNASRAMLAAWATAFLTLTLIQIRFANSFSVVYAIATGVVAMEVFDALRRGRPEARWMRASGWAAFGLAALLTLDTFASFYGPYLQRSALVLQQEGLRRRGLISAHHFLYDVAARWIASRTPPTSGYLDVADRPEYGVLCNWGVGHLLRYRSERPMVQDNFGVYGGRDTFDAAWRYYLTSDEEEAVSILDQLGVRYVLADFQGPGASRPAPWNSMMRLLVDSHGSEKDLASGKTLPALTRHRLVFHAHTDPAGSAGGPLAATRPHTSLGVWEPVAGARVRGSAVPGARIVASVDLTTASGRVHVYEVSVTADEGGRYAFVLPYSNESRFGSAIRTADHYRITSGDVSARLVVSEAAVVEGNAVEGPSL